MSLNGEKTCGVKKMRRKNVHNTNCCVRMCHSRKSKDKSIHFHQFPKEGAKFVEIIDDDGVLRYIDRKDAWERILLMDKPPSPYMRVCSLHFHAKDYDTAGNTSPRLKPTAIPSLQLPKKRILPNTDKKTQVQLQPIVEVYLCCDINIKEEEDLDVELVEVKPYRDLDEYEEQTFSA